MTENFWKRLVIKPYNALAPDQSEHYWNHPVGERPPPFTKRRVEGIRRILRGNLSRIVNALRRFGRCVFFVFVSKLDSSIRIGCKRLSNNVPKNALLGTKKRGSPLVALPDSHRGEWVVVRH